METKDILLAIDERGSIPSRKCNFDFFRSKTAHRQDWIEFIDECESKGYSAPLFVLLCKNNLTSPGVCSICSVNERMMTTYAGNSLSKYCSKECSRNDKNRMREAVKKRDAKPENKEKSLSKRRATMLEKYGVEYNSQREEVKPSLAKNKMSVENRSRVNSYDWMYDQYVTLGKTHEVIAREFNLDKSSITNALRFHEIETRHGYSISYGQRQIFEFIKSLGIKVVLNDRGTLPDRKEIDIYCPENSFAIEYDGLYFHGLGEGYTIEQSRYHRWKVIEASKKGIRLVRITEQEWKTSAELIKSMIRHQLRITERRIFARNCMVREISSKDSRQFLDRNHISGSAPAKVHLGLFLGEELLTVCAFGKPRYRKDAEWEVIRLASEINTSVVGSFQKLLKTFRMAHTGSIITYADRRISDGNVYRRTGFELIGETDPGYVWTDGDKVFSRYQTMRNNLPKILGDRFDSSKTEEANMFASGFKKYHNCGNLVFRLQS